MRSCLVQEHTLICIKFTMFSESSSHKTGTVKGVTILYIESGPKKPGVPQHFRKTAD